MSTPANGQTTLDHSPGWMPAMIGVLVVWIVFGMWLAKTTPCRSQWSYHGINVMPENLLAIFCRYESVPNEPMIVLSTDSQVLDLRTGRMRSAIDAQYALPIDVLDRSRVCWLVEQDTSGPMNIDEPRDHRIVVTSVETGETLLETSSFFKPPFLFRMVQHRYLVHCQPETVQVLDLDSTNARRVVSSVDHHAFIANVSTFEPVFAVLRNIKQPLMEVELCGIDDELKTIARGKWMAACSSPAVSMRAEVGFSAGELATVNTDIRAISVRSTNDGSLLRSIDIPNRYNLAKGDWRFHDHLLVIRSGTCLEVLDWSRSEWRPTIQSSDRYYTVKGDLVRADVGDKRVIWDSKTGEQILECGAKQGRIAEFNHEHAYVTSSQFGGTLQKVAIATNRVVQTWRPYGYVIPCYILWFVFGCAWFTIWLRNQHRKGVRKGAHAWVGSLLVFSVPLGLLTYRAASAGNSLDEERFVYQYLQGVVMAGLAASLTWLVWGRARLTQRLLPPIVLIAVFSAILSRLFRYQLEPAGYLLAVTVIPVLVAVIPLAVLRRIGFSIGLPRDETLGTRTVRYSILDLLWITIAMAVCFAAFRLLGSPADAFNRFDFTSWHQPVLLISATLIPCFVVPLSMSSRSAVIVCLMVIALAALVYLVGESVAEFAYGKQPQDSTVNSPIYQTARLLSSFTASLVAILIPFRNAPSVELDPSVGR